MPVSNTRMSILGTAAEIFSRKGFKASTMRDIAELAGVNNVTIYRHAFDKNTLFKLALEQEADRVHLWNLVEAVTTRLDSNRPETIAMLLVALIDVGAGSRLPGMIRSTLNKAQIPRSATTSKRHS